MRTIFKIRRLVALYIMVSTLFAGGTQLLGSKLDQLAQAEKSAGFSGQGTSARKASDPQGCRKPKQVQTVTFSASKYPNIARHTRQAIAKGWPSVVVVNRAGADKRRDELLADIPTRRGYDRDEYPPAAGRGHGQGLQRGSSPSGWKASVMYVPSAENRSHGSVMGSAISHWCSGTHFRYAFK